MEIIKDFKNNLLKRREMQVSKDYNSNPGIEHSKNELSLKFKVEQNLILIKKLYNSFGTKNFIIDFYIYDTVEDLNRFEPKKKKEKNKK
jgi:ribosomal protein S24E